MTQSIQAFGRSSGRSRCADQRRGALQARDPAGAAALRGRDTRISGPRALPAGSAGRGLHAAPALETFLPRQERYSRRPATARWGPSATRGGGARASLEIGARTVCCRLGLLLQHFSPLGRRRPGELEFSKMPPRPP